MKFKYLMIAFSAVIVVIILIIAMLPVMLAGSQSAVNLRNITIPLLLFMSLLLVLMGIFFFLNYRLLSLLEREDWPALAYYLERKVFVNGRYSARYVRILASSYLVISDYPSMLKLESKALLVRPSVVYKNILIFGAARVLSGKHKEAAAFFKSHLEKGKIKEKEWARWFYGFSQLLGGAFTMAEPDFAALAVSSKDALITGLSAFFLGTSLEKYSLKPEECLSIAEKGRNRVIGTLKSLEGWEKEVSRVENDIHIAIIRKYIDETGNWIFAPPQVEEEPETEEENEEETL